MHAVREALEVSMRGPKGLCYVASEAIYHALGGKSAGITPQVVHHEGGTHWYLLCRDGSIIDATADQFQTPVPYGRGRGCGFLTREPSARAQAILDALRGRAA